MDSYSNDIKELRQDFKELKGNQTEILNSLAVINNRISDVTLVQEKLNNLEKRVDAQEHVLWGVGGENGLRSDVKAIAKKQDKTQALILKITGVMIALGVIGEILLNVYL